MKVLGNFTTNKKKTACERSNQDPVSSFEEIPTEISRQQRLQVSHGRGCVILQKKELTLVARHNARDQLAVEKDSTWKSNTSV